MGELARSNTELTILSLDIKSDTITANLSDGRVISVPIAWFPRLVDASKEKLSKFEISPSGYGIHWPELDEDISVKAFVSGF